jgi:Ulp1 family protease
MRRHKEKIEPKKPGRNFVIERRTKEQDEEEIEKEIQRQLEVKMSSAKRVTRQEAKIGEESNKRRDYSSQEVNQAIEGSYGGQASPGSSKKVVKKRVVKMMKDGIQVAEKEEILDEDGNIIRTIVKRDGFEAVEEP